MLRADFEARGTFVGGREFADPFGAVAIEGNDGGAYVGTVHDDEVMRLVGRKGEVCGFGRGGRAVNAKIGHAA